MPLLAGSWGGALHDGDFLRRQAVERINLLVDLALQGARVGGGVRLLGSNDALDRVRDLCASRSLQQFLSNRKRSQLVSLNV